MSNASNKGEGIAQQVGGKIKELAGKVLGNEQLEAEGKAKQLEGKARVEAAKAAERTKGKVEEVAGAIKNRAGTVIDNEQMEGRGPSSRRLACQVVRVKRLALPLTWNAVGETWVKARVALTSLGRRRGSPVSMGLGPTRPTRAQ